MPSLVESVDRLYGHYVAAVKVRVDSELHASAALILGACPSITLEQFLDHARMAYEESREAIFMQFKESRDVARQESTTGSTASAPVPSPGTGESSEVGGG